MRDIVGDSLKIAALNSFLSLLKDGRVLAVIEDKMMNAKHICVGAFASKNEDIECVRMHIPKIWLEGLNELR